MRRKRILPYVEIWRDRHKRLRVYFRRDRGPRIALPDTIGSTEFNAAYAAALAGNTPENGAMRPSITVSAPGSLSALIASYMRSADYLGLRDTSKAGYYSRLETIRADHGHRTVSGLSRERIVTGILQPYADRPGAALDTLKKLRILIRHAINIGWIKNDPSLGIKRPKLQHIRSWSEAEIKAFRDHWPLRSKQRLAFELFLNTGQRRSDVVRMAWSHIVMARSR